MSSPLALVFASLFAVATSRPTADRPQNGEVLNGRQRQLAVKPPRLDEVGLKMDATLDEPQWKQAATLTGFSQFAPRDGIPAEDSTEVLVWYSATAIHFGIRAFEPHGAVRAALGDRDKIFSDDRVELLHRHLQRRTSGRGARRQRARRADGRHARREQSGARRRLRQLDGGARGARPEPRLRLPVEGTAHRVRLRGRGARSLQEPQVSERRLADMGIQRGARRPALGTRGQLDAGESRECVLPPAVGDARGADRPASRARARRHARAHAADDRGARHRPAPSWQLRRGAAEDRRQRALGDEQQPHAQRHGQSRLLADRVGCGAGVVRSAPGAVLRREASLLPRRHGVLRHAEEPRLHAPHRAAGGRREDHRQDVGLQPRPAQRGGRHRRLARWREPSGVHHRAHPAATSARAGSWASRSPTASEGALYNRVASLDGRRVFGVDLQRAGAVRAELHASDADERQHERAALERRAQPEREGVQVPLRVRRGGRALPHAERLHRPRRHRAGAARPVVHVLPAARPLPRDDRLRPDVLRTRGRTARSSTRATRSRRSSTTASP